MLFAAVVQKYWYTSFAPVHVQLFMLSYASGVDACLRCHSAGESCCRAMRACAVTYGGQPYFSMRTRLLVVQLKFSSKHTNSYSFQTSLQAR
jgi:hypothetical protein